MRRWEKEGRQGGFTLVEILVVMAIMGVVTMAVYSLYQTNQRTATTQDNVVELQQNLRIGLDRMERDIRMAGFMVPAGTNPLSTATATSLTLNTASADGRIARIAAPGFNSPPTNTYVQPVPVASADMASMFSNGNVVRIIRPPGQNEVIASNPFTVFSTTGTTINLTGFNTPNIVFQAGDVIVRTTSSSAPNPNTVTYALGTSPTHQPDQLIRTVNQRDPDESSAVVAEGLTAPTGTNPLAFTYLLDTGPPTQTPSAAQMSQIKAVEITLTGQAKSSDGTIKTRQIQGLVTIRNRVSN